MMSGTAAIATNAATFQNFFIKRILIIINCAFLFTIDDSNFCQISGKLHSRKSPKRMKSELIP